MKKLIVLVVLLIAAFAAGYVPQYLKASQLSNDAQGLRDQLGACRSEKQLSDLKVEMGVMYVDAARNNFGIAGDESTKFFTELREVVSQTVDAGRKSKLDEILAARDRITAGLAKADPGITSEIRDLFLAFQKI